MKNILLTIFVGALLMALITDNSEAQFKKAGLFLGPNLTLATTPIGFGGDIEYGITDNFGLGGYLRYWGRSEAGWSWSVIIPQAQGAYHFMPRNELDPYVGARLGYAIFSTSGTYSGSSGSDLFLTGVGGLRYYLSPKVSLNGSLEFRIGGTDYFGTGLGLVAGVDFTL